MNTVLNQSTLALKTDTGAAVAASASTGRGLPDLILSAMADRDASLALMALAAGDAFLHAVELLIAANAVIDSYHRYELLRIRAFDHENN